ncbi:unnamed protein product [Caenorhabditis nigoni]
MVPDHPTPSAASYANSTVSNVVRQIVYDLRTDVSDRTSLKKLTKFFVEKLDGLAQTTRLFMEHAGQTQPSIQDVLAAFHIHRINIQDLIASERERPPLPILSRYQFVRRKKETELKHKDASKQRWLSRYPLTRS